MSRIMIGIPCYQNVAAETLEDYMRFAYHLGRRNPQHEFLLAIKAKTEQFRARNAIVEGALQSGCDYLFFLDDDHVIDWNITSGPNQAYDIVADLVKHCEDDPKIGIVGAVYYHRGAECRPVLMKEGKDGGYYYIRDDELIYDGLQDVDVQGGGCFLINLEIFNSINSPWFEPEYDYGTDIQICRKAKEAGFRVCCDTSIQIGHVRNTREIVTPQNRHRIAMENAQQVSGGQGGIKEEWLINSALNLYRTDLMEYLHEKTGKVYDTHTMEALVASYNTSEILNWDDKEEYYRQLGVKQLARQCAYHHMDHTVNEMEMIHKMVNTSTEGYGCDYGCGSAPVGFELALRGHKMDFVDVSEAAIDFIQWRADKRAITNRCGYELKGPYDYVLMLDSLEHIENWQEVLKNIIDSLKEGQPLITNFFFNNDYDNPEHITMDKRAISGFLTSNGLYPTNQLVWVKRDLSFTRKEVAA